MRNSSDIFCLKEPKIGENDGSQIFSVNGSCFSKINRRNRNSSDVLHFETSKINQEIPENSSDLPTTPEEASESPHALDDNKQEISEQIGDTKREEEKIKSEDIPKESVANCSSMRRNPVTGDGLEEEEKHSFKRRCGKKTGKWLW